MAAVVEHALDEPGRANPQAIRAHGSEEKDYPHGSRLLDCPRASEGNFFIDLRSVPTHADGAHDLAVDGHGDSALQWRGISERQRGNASVGDLVLEDLAGPTIDRRCSRLANPDIDTRHLCGVHAGQMNDLSAIVDHDDHHANVA